MTRRQMLLAGAGLASACTQAKAFDGYAYVANEEGNAVAVVDLAIFAVIRHIRLEGSPTALVLHESRPLLYVLAPAEGRLYEINTERLEIARRLDCKCRLIAMRPDPSTPSIFYLLAADRPALLRVDTEAMSVVGEFKLPAQPIDFDVSEKYTRLAGFSYGDSGATSLLSLDTGEQTPLVKIGSSAGIARFRSGGEAFLAANPQDRMLTVIDAPSGRIMTHLPLAVRPERFCFNRDRGQLFITGEGMDAVVVVYPHDIPQVAETALAGRAPGAMAASEKYLFVANPLTNDLSIFNAATRRLVAMTQVGTEPGFIAITPNDEFALVLNQRSGDMAVINIRKIAPSRHRSAGLLTMIPLGSKPVAAVVSKT